MRVLVCGGRTYSDVSRVWEVLCAIEFERGGISCIIHGAARGADRLAERWAHTFGVLKDAYPAYWATHGKAAGAIRNKQMIVEGKPDLVVAFPGGRGTANMVQQARLHGIDVMEIDKEPGGLHA